MENLYFTRVCIYMLGYIIAVFIGHLIVVSVLRKFKDPLPETGLKKAGAVIGILERIFVLTLVIMEQYTGIALIFTAKSITRFENLNNREFAEYYLIGTLTSILVSMIIGIGMNWVLKFT